MCNVNVINWFTAHLSAAQVRGRRVLEVGSRDVNGSIRPVFQALDPAEYVGIDLKAGPGVDVVCDVCDAVARFGRGRFDIVATSSALEHVENLQRAVLNMQLVCAADGLLALSVPNRWKRHNYPRDYWRFTESGLITLFGQCQCLRAETIEQTRSKSTLFAMFRVPPGLRDEAAIIRLTE